MGATLIFITGKSGSGKDTIQKELIAYDRDNNLSQKKLHKMKLYTTREKRECENDDDYTFLTDESFIEEVHKKTITEHRVYYMSDKTGKSYSVCYGSSGVDFDKDNIYIGNGAIDQLMNYINLHLRGRSKSQSLSWFSSLGDIYDLSKHEINNESDIIVIYPYVSEDKRIARLMDRSINNDKDINYYELYRRQYQDYEKFGDIYNILDNTAKHVLAHNDDYLEYVSFNKYSRITYCFVNNMIDYETLHNKIIPNLYEQIVLTKIYKTIPSDSKS